MDLNLKGFKANKGHKQMGDVLIHKGRRLTERETRMVVNWGINQGYKNASELPGDVVDEICNPYCSTYDEYDDTPEFVSIQELQSILRRISDEGYIEEQTPDELINKIKDEL